MNTKKASVILARGLFQVPTVITDIDVPADTENVPQWIFHRTNSPEFATPLYEGRCLSVGDIVVHGGKASVCASCGWIEIPADPQVVVAPERYRAVRETGDLDGEKRIVLRGTGMANGYPLGMTVPGSKMRLAYLNKQRAQRGVAEIEADWSAVESL